MIQNIIKIAAGLFLLLVIAFLLLPDNEEEKKNVVKYWFVAGVKDDIPPCVKLFNESQDSIYVECTPIPWNEHEKKVLTAILSENPPDVVNLVTPVPKWAARKALVKLDDIISKDRLDTNQFFSSLWGEMKYRNNTYALPAYTGAYSLFYNKKIFKEAGLDPEKPPKTWNEIREYSKKILKRENGKIVRMGFVPQYGTIETPLIIAFELGAKFISDDGTKVMLNDPLIEKAFKWEHDFFDVYSVEEVTAFMGGFGYGNQHGFISEKVAILINDNSFIDQIKRYKPGLDYGVALIPTIDGLPPVSSTGSWWLAIPRGAKNKNAAWEFMKFVVSRETQLKESMSRDETLFPVNRYAANDSSFLSMHKYMKIFTDQMEHTRTKSIVPLAHDTFWREFSFARERSLRNITTAKQALKEAGKTVQSFLDRAIDYDNYVNSKMKTEGFFD